MPLTADDLLYKDAVKDLIEYGQSFRTVSSQGVTLSLNPCVKDQGMTQQPGNGDVQYCQTYLVYVGRFAIEEDAIPPAAFEVGAEWQMTNRAGDTINYSVLQPVKEAGLYNEVILIPSLIS